MSTLTKPTLPHKISTDADGISQLTFNRIVDCLDYAMSWPKADGSTVIVTPGNRLRAVNQTGGGSGGGEKYNGYFLLGGDGSNVTVKDGGGSGSSYCKVNNRGFSVPDTTLARTNETYVIIHFQANLTETTFNVVVELANTVPDDSATDVRYILGTIASTGIVQRHTNGIPQLWWGVSV